MNKIIIEFHNIVLAFEYNLNVILLDQLLKNVITYYDNPNIIALMKSDKTIIYTKKSYILFTLDLAMFNQIILAISNIIAIQD